MDWFVNLPYLTIFAAMFAAILLSVVKNNKVCWTITFIITLAVSVMSLIFLIQIAAADYSTAFTMGKYAAPFGNEIKVGPLQGILAFTFSTVMALCLLGGRKDTFADIVPKKMSLYCVMINMTMASLLVLTYTNDVFTGYVFLEIGTIAACALVMAKDSGPTQVATIRYLFMSLFGSGLFLLSLVILYTITGHLLMPQLAEQVAILAKSGQYRLPLAFAAALMTAGLGVKGAMFPFHRWLPDAHGTATTTSSAVLSGLVLKGYIVLLITIFVRVFTLDVIRSMGINYLLLFCGIGGMIVGSVYAIKETHIKRMLAYSSVAQIGYIFLGLGVCHPIGVACAIFQILTHACTKPLLFLSAGRLSVLCGHKKQLKDLKGSAYLDKTAGIGFTVGGLSMVGIPLLTGFSAKYFLAQAAWIESSFTIWMLIALGVSSILNAIYYIPAIAVIWSKNEETEKISARPEKDKSFMTAAILLIAAIVFLGIAGVPTFDLILRGFELM